MKSKEILTTAELVKNLLEKHSYLRDNDKKLVANIWAKEIGSKFKNIDLNTFLKDYFINGNVTSSDTITRARRKVQEEFLELRGNIVSIRKELEKEVRQNIN